MKSLFSMVCLLAAVGPMAHASTVHADKLPQPKNMACLQVKPALSYTIARGWLHIPWEIELGQGSYVSEREDANGVYYRAPAGAITERRTDVKPDSRAARATSFEGGIYVPDNASVAPTIYEYYGSASLVAQSAPGDADCSKLAYAVDPYTRKVSVTGTGLAMGFGAGMGAMTGRFINPRVHMSYGQAAGAGLVGGLVGGLIVAAIEKGKVGEILSGPALDSQTSEKIRILAANKVMLRKLGSANGTSVATATPAPPAVTSGETSVAPASPVLTASSPYVATQSGADANVQTTAAPQAITNTVTDAALTSKAQSIADQLRCGAVKFDGGDGFVASCGSYGVYIECDAGQCRPLHTVKL